MSLQGKHVVLGVTGGIAAYKSCTLASRLRKEGAIVRVILTEHAARFVTPLTFETLTNQPVAPALFARPATWEVEHISLAKQADLFVIAPATANILAKMACGIADDMLSTTVLATRAPVLVAPAMNTQMWTAEITQQNVETLRKRGVHFIGPEGGFLACGDEGAGRMSEPEQIFEAARSLLEAPQDLQGLRVLVTAGGTREQLDPVRYLGNESSGKMGFALAEAARARGAEVQLVCGTTTAAEPAGIPIRRVGSTLDLLHAMEELAPQADIVIQAAAPADYRFGTVHTQKIKKQDGVPLTLTLVENPDVAAAVGQAKRPGQTLVGFAAETQHLAENAERKLSRKNLDLIVANDVTQPGAGFGVDTNIVTMITRDGAEQLPLMSKLEVAGRILDKVLELRSPA